MSTYKPSEYNCECPPNEGCEFEVPIKVNVPVTINPILSINQVGPVKENLNFILQPNINLHPEVGATQPTCLPKNGYSKRELPAANESQILP